MLQHAKTFTLAGIIFCTVKLCLAQGTLQATLFPDPPNGSPLSGSIVVNTPDTSGVGPFFTVSFEMTVNSNAPIFTVGRIAGGSTAWAFDLDAPTIINSSAFYTGTTDMGAFQIDDMLANITDFQIYSYEPYTQLDGALVAVPEPQSVYLLTAGIVIAYLVRVKRANRPTSRSYRNSVVD